MSTMIHINNLSKKYFKTHRIAKPRNRFEMPHHYFKRNDTVPFWALKNISFTLKQGEILGLIGSNGSGKSTLLKILSRITSPTMGEVKLYGRVGSLLEVGTGFHQELSGRENIYLNGSILGMSKSEITEKYEEIVAFSGVAKFIDTPIKIKDANIKVTII